MTSQDEANSEIGNGPVWPSSNANDDRPQLRLKRSQHLLASSKWPIEVKLLVRDGEVERRELYTARTHRVCATAEFSSYSKTFVDVHQSNLTSISVFFKVFANSLCLHHIRIDHLLHRARLVASSTSQEGALRPGALRLIITARCHEKYQNICCRLVVVHGLKRDKVMIAIFSCFPI